MPPTLRFIHHRARQTYQSVRDLTQREKRHLLSELQQTSGLMPILMKQRNGQRWTREDRLLMREHFNRLSRLSPYLVMVVMPGGLLVLPVFAWWLDRRRTRARPGQPPVK